MIGFLARWGGKALGFFGGGIGGYVAIGGLVALGLSGIALAWAIDRGDEALADKGHLEQALLSEREMLKVYGQQITAMAGVIDRQERRYEAEQLLRIEREKERDTLRRERDTMRNQVRNLKNADEEVRDYLDRPIPSALLDCLRHPRKDDCGAPSTAERPGN